MITGGFLPSAGFVTRSGSSSATPPNVWGTFVTTRGADGTRPVSTDGTAVTPGTGGSMGSYANLGVLSASVAIKEIEIVVHTVSVASSNRSVSIDVAVDTTGAGSYDSSKNVITDLQCGAPGLLIAAAGSGQESRFTFQYQIPAGASIGVRGSSLDATTTAFRVYVNGFGTPSQSTLVRSGTGIQTLGVATPGTVAGTAITPGTTSDGTWVDVGTLAQDVFALEFGYLINATSLTAGMIVVDVGLGNASAPDRTVISNATVYTNGNETVFKRSSTRGQCAGLSGEHVWVRAQHSGTPESGNSVAVYATYGTAS